MFFSCSNFSCSTAQFLCYFKINLIFTFLFFKLIKSFYAQIIAATADDRRKMSQLNRFLSCSRLLRETYWYLLKQVLLYLRSYPFFPFFPSVYSSFVNSAMALNNFSTKSCKIKLWKSVESSQNLLKNKV